MGYKELECFPPYGMSGIPVKSILSILGNSILYIVEEMR